MSMNVHDFIRKWSQVALTERSASQQHFLDLCEILGHPKPAEADPEGESFTFEKGAAKYGGGSGWADVWKRGFFAWEYKRRHADLAGAYDQLLRYREVLENPPLFVVCEMDRIVVHTNFTDQPTIVHDIALEELGRLENLEIIRAVFFDPKRLRPDTTPKDITQEAASRLADIARAMNARGLDSHDVARFLERIAFVLFAQDVNLLPEKIFSRLLKNSREDPEVFARLTSELFRAMAHGGFWGVDLIRPFNADLFNDGPVPTPTLEELKKINKAARLSWGAVDPSVFGALFEQGGSSSQSSPIGFYIAAFG